MCIRDRVKNVQELSGLMDGVLQFHDDMSLAISVGSFTIKVLFILAALPLVEVRMVLSLNQKASLLLRLFCYR